MEIMRKYCLGSRPCQVEVLSDQSIDFGHTSRTITSVNYEDPNLNISMPVFSIHGNHDDPAGSGSLSAIDLLSVAGFLNHFGRATSLEKIEISPVLLQKGSTKLALYGLGSIRDERLHRIFLKKNVKFLRPKENTDEWFNIMTIHQNRAKHGQTNYIPEQFLDEFFDLVIWGHEHECMGTMQWNSIQNFFVLQPGSTVATSLTAGESKQKHVTLLHIRGKDMKPEYIPLRSVRNMYVEDIVLKDVSCISDPTKPMVEEEIQAYCEERVESILIKAEDDLSGHPKQPKLPLIRLRVDYSGGYPTFNPYRLGANFTENVANPDSIVHFLKKSTRNMVKGEKQDMSDLDDLIVNEVVEKVKVEDLVEEYLLNNTKYQMSLLSARGMSMAVREYVEKKEKDAIYDLCEHQLDKVSTHLKQHNLLTMEQDRIVEEIARYKEEKKSASMAASNNAGGGDDEFQSQEDVRAILARVKLERSARGVATPNIDSDDEMVISDSEAQITASTRGKRGGRGGRGSKGSTRGRGRGSRSTRGSKAAIPVVESTPVSRKTGNIMDAFNASSQRNQSIIKSNITKISDSDDDVQMTSYTAPKPKRRNTKRGRGVEFSSDDENPFGEPASTSKRRR
ncbi:double-strand break repair protein MRE11-like isoform X2 [Styela clava]